MPPIKFVALQKEEHLSPLQMLRILDIRLTRQVLHSREQ